MGIELTFVKHNLTIVRKVYTDKFPNDTYGVYWNESPNSVDGADLSVGWFFDNFSWLSEDMGFDKKYEEVHGAGSWESFLKEWGDLILSEETELWEFRPDLSGLPSKVSVAQRQLKNLTPYFVSRAAESKPGFFV